MFYRTLRRNCRFKRGPIFLFAATSLTAICTISWRVVQIIEQSAFSPPPVAIYEGVADNNDSAIVVGGFLLENNNSGIEPNRARRSFNAVQASPSSPVDTRTRNNTNIVSNVEMVPKVTSSVPKSTQRNSTVAQTQPVQSTQLSQDSVGPWPSRPFFFKNGSYRPGPSSISSQHAALYPGESPTGGDRIVEQLMFTPNISNKGAKKILITSGFEWVPEGSRAFFEPVPCQVTACSIHRANSLSIEDADLVLFQNAVNEVSVPRNRINQIWLLYILESPHHSSGTGPSNSVNWTATYRTDSDIVAPYEKWVYYNPEVKSMNQTKNYALNKTKQVAWFVSNCGARTNRLEYARELQKHIGVDIYGACGDKACPRGDPQCTNLLNKDYKFYLAFENSHCKDYVTEKFYVNGLSHDVLPIVMGARKEEYEKVAPRKSFIHVDDFASPQQLAQHLNELDKNDDAYNEYFRWKGTGETIDTRFWCRVCGLLHDPGRKPKHYEDVNKWWTAGICW